MSSAKNSQPLVFGNFSRGCFTMASNGTSWRMVPTGYSVLGTLSLKIRIASASCLGSGCLMRVFRTWGQSRMHPKVCSDTETSAEDATDTIQKTSPATSRLRLNIRLPFCAMANTRHLFIKARRHATRVTRLRGEINKMGLWSQSRHIGPKLLCAAGALDDAAGRSLRSALRRHARRHKDLHMLIVDAQIHLWNAGNPTTPWHRQIPAYTKADALSEMDAGGVDAAVLTPHTPWDPKANELAIEAARQHPDRFVILGNFPVAQAESRGLVDTWNQRPGMVGLRFVF